MSRLSLRQSACRPALTWLQRLLSLLTVIALALAGLVAGVPLGHAATTTAALGNYDYDHFSAFAQGADTSTLRMAAPHEGFAPLYAFARAGVAAEEGAVDRTTPAARTHILEGETRPNGTFAGGHRSGTGFPGKSEFPSGWSDDRVVHEISDVATDPASTAVQQGSRTVVTGTRGGVTIRAVIDNRTGEILTGYPTNVPRNP